MTRQATPGTTDAWFDRRTWQHPRWTEVELCDLRGGRRVSVVLPALDEEATVGGVVRSLHPLTTGPDPLVSDLLVIDSGSRDRTREEAERAGARVVSREAADPDTIPVRPGKGEVLWRALAATDGDILVYVDADLVDVPDGLVPALLGPLLLDPGIALVKGFYRRPLRIGADADAAGGGRVTELVARPLLAALFPELDRVVQPLGGEYAATREFLRSVPFAAGYGVEIGLLIDALRSRGLDAIGQVNLGVRKHRNRSLLDLGPMARQITATVLDRAGVADSGAELVQFRQLASGGWHPHPRPVELRPRPAASRPAPPHRVESWP